jgi:HEPN domain-containing protein
MSAAEESRAWMAKAENDFLNIHNNLAASEIPWDTVCFHAEQGAEKYLKAFLVLFSSEAPRTHDVIALLDKCTQVDSSLARLASDCHLLADYAVKTRYPEPGLETSMPIGQEAVAAARRVRDEMRKRLLAA